MNKELEKLIQDAVDRGMFKNQNNGMDIDDSESSGYIMAFVLLFLCVGGILRLL